MIENAAAICAEADLFLLIGTSLAVYPAASLLDFVPNDVPKYIVDPKIPTVNHYKNIIKIEKSATAGLLDVYEMLKLYE